MPVISVIEAVRDAMREEMRRDPDVFVMGEDVGRRGGVFLATQGFLDEFGEARVIDTPLAESAIAGVAVGAAMKGMRPIAEIQFADFAYPTFNQIIGDRAVVFDLTHHETRVRDVRDDPFALGFARPIRVPQVAIPHRHGTRRAFDGNGTFFRRNFVGIRMTVKSIAPGNH